MSGYHPDQAVNIKPFGNADLCMYYTFKDNDHNVKVDSCKTVGDAGLWTLLAVRDEPYYYIYNKIAANLRLSWWTNDVESPIIGQAWDKGDYKQYWVKLGSDNKAAFTSRQSNNPPKYLASYPNSAGQTLVGLRGDDEVTDDTTKFWAIVKVDDTTPTTPASSTTSNPTATPPPSNSQQDSTGNASSSSGTSTTTIVVAVVIPIVVLIVAGIMFWVWRRRKIASKGQYAQTPATDTPDEGKQPEYGYAAPSSPLSGPPIYTPISPNAPTEVPGDMVHSYSPPAPTGSNIGSSFSPSPSHFPPPASTSTELPAHGHDMGSLVELPSAPPREESGNIQSFK